MSALATATRDQLALDAPTRRDDNLDLELLRHERSRHTDGGRPTLEQLLDGVWEGLHAAGVADCPVCGSGRMTHDGCDGCGSRLS